MPIGEKQVKSQCRWHQKTVRKPVKSQAFSYSQMLYKHVKSSATRLTATCTVEYHQYKQAENHAHIPAISFFHHWLMVGKKPLNVKMSEENTFSDSEDERGS